MTKYRGFDIEKDIDSWWTVRQDGKAVFGAFADDATARNWVDSHLRNELIEQCAEIAEIPQPQSVSVLVHAKNIATMIRDMKE